MIAVLLLAFGCPDSLESIEPFITNVMGGRNPSPEQLQKIKERYLMIGGRSPLLDITRRQAKALEITLNEVKEFGSYRVQELTPKLLNSKTPELFRVFVGMRHWHPFIKDTLKEIVDSGAKKIIAVIMAPHHSRFSADGYINALDEAKSELLSISPPYIRGSERGLNISFVDSWHTHPLFLEAVADEIKKGLTYFKDVDTAPLSPPSQGGEREGVQVIFSAHSLPKKSSEFGVRSLEGKTKPQTLKTQYSILDTEEGRGEELYVRQLNETIQGIIKLKGSISWHLGFQSKGMSPGKWLEPTIDSILERISKEGKKYVLLVPVGFVSDHIETLYDIDIVYRKMAESLGMKFHRTASLNDSPKFIEALAKVIIESLKEK